MLTFCIIKARLRMMTAGSGCDERRCRTRETPNALLKCTG